MAVRTFRRRVLTMKSRARAGAGAGSSGRITWLLSRGSPGTSWAEQQGEGAAVRGITSTGARRHKPTTTNPQHNVCRRGLETLQQPRTQTQAEKREPETRGCAGCIKHTHLPVVEYAHAEGLALRVCAHVRLEAERVHAGHVRLDHVQRRPGLGRILHHVSSACRVWECAYEEVNNMAAEGTHPLKPSISAAILPVLMPEPAHTPATPTRLLQRTCGGRGLCRRPRRSPRDTGPRRSSRAP